MDGMLIDGPIDLPEFTPLPDLLVTYIPDTDSDPYPPE